MHNYLCINWLGLIYGYHLHLVAMLQINLTDAMDYSYRKYQFKAIFMYLNENMARVGSLCQPEFYLHNGGVAIEFYSLILLRVSCYNIVPWYLV